MTVECLEYFQRLIIIQHYFYVISTDCQVVIYKKTIDTYTHVTYVLIYCCILKRRHNIVLISNLSQ